MSERIVQRNDENRESWRNDNIKREIQSKKERAQRLEELLLQLQQDGE